MINIYLKRENDPRLKEINAIASGSWVHLTDPDDKEIKEISLKTGLDPDMLKNALDEDEKPRVEKEGRTTYLIIRVPSKTSENTIKVYPVGIAVTENIIVTVCLREVKIFNEFMQEKAKDFFTTKRSRFVLLIFKKTNRFFQLYLDEIENKINKIEKRLLKSSKNEEVIELLNIQKSLIFVNRAVVSNAKVFEKLTHGKAIKLYKADEELLDDLIIENNESIEMVQIFINILANTMDAYASIISNNLNIGMKFLASITIILAIPSLVAGFYGMNIALPFQHSRYAFFYTILISVMGGAVASYYLFKKGYF